MMGTRRLYCEHIMLGWNVQLQIGLDHLRDGEAGVGPRALRTKP